MAIANVGRGRRPVRRDVVFGSHTNTRVVQDILINEINGRKWNVDYFNKQVTEGETVTSFDVNEPIHLQNFKHIENMQLHVIDEIPTVGDIDDIVGAAYITADITPNTGDVIVAKLSGSTIALLSIKEAKKHSYNNDGIYRIDYNAIKIFHSQQEVVEFLDVMKGGVIEELVYDDEAQANNSTPIIAKKSLHTLHSILRLREHLVRQYFAIMTNPHLGENRFVYANDVRNRFIIDRGLARFVHKVIPFRDVLGSDYIMELNLKYEANNLSFWDILLDDVHPAAINRYARYSMIGAQVTTDLSMIYMENFGNEIKVTNDEPLPVKDGVIVSDTDELYYRTISYKKGNSILIPDLYKTTYVLSPKFYKELGDGDATIISDNPEFVEDTNSTTTADNGDDGSSTEDGSASNDTSSTLPGDSLTKLEVQLLNLINRGTAEPEEVVILIEDGLANYSRTEVAYFFPILIAMCNVIASNRGDSW